MFQKFFGGPFPGAPGAHAHHFRIPLLLLHNISKTFFISKKVSKNFWALSRGPRGSRPSFGIPLLLLHTLSKTKKTFFQNNFEKIFWGPFPGCPGLTPTIFEIPFSCYIPSQKIFFSKIFSKIFLGPFPGPPRFAPTIFEFPFSCYITSQKIYNFKFFQIFFWALSHGPRGSCPPFSNSP